MGWRRLLGTDCYMSFLGLCRLIDRVTNTSWYYTNQEVSSTSTRCARLLNAFTNCFHDHNHRWYNPLLWKASRGLSIDHLLRLHLTIGLNWLYVRAAFEGIYGVFVKANTVKWSVISLMKGTFEITYENPLKIVYSWLIFPPWSVACFLALHSNLSVYWCFLLKRDVRFHILLTGFGL